MLPRLRRYAKLYVRGCFPCPASLWVAGLRSLFRHFAFCRRAALRLPGSSASGGRARPRFAAAVRLMAPSLRSRRPGRSLSPRLSRSGGSPALARSSGRSLPSLRCGFPSVRCGLLWSPLLPSWSPLRLGPPRRVPLGRPLRGFGPGASSPGAFAAFRRRALDPPRALFLLGCFAPCAFPPAGFLPRAPPVPAAPAGGSGEARGLRPWGLRPPQLRCSPGVGFVKPCAFPL